MGSEMLLLSEKSSMQALWGQGWERLHTCRRPTCPQHPHAPRIRRCRQRNEVAPASDAITATDTERLPTNGTVTLKQNLCVHGCGRERHRGGQGAGIGEAERENKLRQTRCHAAQLYS